MPGRPLAFSVIPVFLTACASPSPHKLTCTTPDNSPEVVMKRILGVDSLPASLEIIECKTGVYVIDPNGTDRNVCAFGIDPLDFSQLLSRLPYAEKPYLAQSGFIETLKVDPGVITTRYYLHNRPHPGHMMFSNAERTYIVAYRTFDWCWNIDAVVN